MSEFDEGMAQCFNLALRVKKALKAKGKQRGWTKCPRCGGRINAVLAGRKEHIHMACETKNCMQVME